jgi:DNA-binding transcriptional LysR family regulator
VFSLIDERDINYILKVAEERSFSQAAKRLYVTQPSLSQCIKKVESELGVELFDRRTNPLTLTFAGELYINEAKRIQEIKKELIQQIEDMSELKRGHLTIGSSHSRTSYLLPRVLPAFCEQFPGIDISLIEGNTVELQEYALSGTTDFSLVYLPLLHPELDYVKIVDEEILVALPSKHPFSRAVVNLPQKLPFPPIDFSRLIDEPFIVMKNRRKMREIFFDLCKRAKFEPKIILQSHSLISAQALVAGGVGATLVPDTLALYNKLEHNPYYFSLSKPVPPRVLVTAYKKDVQLSKAAIAFIELTKEIIQTGKNNR